jgi:hypothetical protein
VAAASTLYGHLGQPSSLYDVTQGGNGYCDGEAAGACGEPEINEEFGAIDCEGTTACDATPGFDGPSGVGTPNGLGAFNGSTGSGPTVVTGTATSVTATSAVLNSTVNPNGATVSACKFEWGGVKYGKSAPCSTLPGSGTSAVAVSATVAVKQRRTYHFRITAINAFGTSDGEAAEFKTPRP